MQRSRTPGLGVVERVAADEVAVGLAHAEGEPGLKRRLVRRDVGSPHAVALLEPQRIDRAIPAGDEPVRVAGLPQRPPQPGAVLGRAVQLPAELAGVRDPERPDRHIADRDLPHRHVREVE